ncbi:MAG: dihydrofolate reductase [Bdellovibrio sp.]|nr:dihydrofolate reductase [Bdellovibrio sp.]
MILTHIVACSENNVIGSDGGLPWSLPEDMKFFRDTTKGHIMIMGRKTFASFNGRALPNRYHIVITRDPKSQIFQSTESSPVVFVSSIEEAIAHAKPLTARWGDEVFIIGGGEIYKQSLPLTDKIYLTRIHQQFQGDTVYPEIDEKVFNLAQRRDVETPISFSFLTYLRK